MNRVFCALILSFLLAHGSLARQVPAFRIRNSGFSAKNLIAGSCVSGGVFRPAKRAVSRADTVRVLALRVEFQKDEDERTTGDGSFDLSMPASQTIDPPPHDRAYFTDQLTAMENYYRAVSGGKLIVIHEVPEPVFVMAHEMAQYSPDLNDEEDSAGLALLFQEAVLAADGADVDFSMHDCVIVFHAGVGRDIDLGYDPTPSDIPSVFLTLEDLKQGLGGGSGFAGIPLSSGGTVSEGILLPETQSQEGYEIGLLGTLSLMFGFQIGLPALWDTNTGLSGIGRWGLMDQGSNNYNGLIPARPCAWSRIALGWEQAKKAEPGVSLSVAASYAGRTGDVYRVDINDREYFLIENRNYDSNGDSITTGRDGQGNTVIFREDGTLEASAPFGVIVEVEEYDYGIPGSGLLIWHIDEQVIASHLFLNQVNSDPERRGVDLEEADGAQDIGQLYSLTEPGSGSETGVLHDAWFASNSINMLVNKSDSVVFGPATYPDTRSNSGANSHLVLYAFSEVDTLMHFRFRHERMRSGFPGDFGLGESPFSPLFADLDGDGSLDIVVPTRSGRVFAWDRFGNPLLDNDSTGKRAGPSGDTLTFSVPLIADASQPVAVEPAAGDLDGDGSDEIVLAAGNVVFGWDAQDSNGDGFGDLVFQEQTGDEVTALLLSPRNGSCDPVAGTEGGEVLLLRSGAANPVWSCSVGSPVAGLCLGREGSEDFVFAATEDGRLFSLDADDGSVRGILTVSGRPLSNPVSGIWPEGLTTAVWDGEQGFLVRNGEIVGILDRIRQPLYAPALGDLDGDGFPEVILAGDDRLWAFNHNGSLGDYFPMPYTGLTAPFSGPLLADWDGDGICEPAFADGDGDLEALKEGRRIEGFPLTTGCGAAYTPFAGDLDGDGILELAAVSSRGFLSVWEIEGSSAAVNWACLSGDAGRTGFFERQPDPPAPEKNWMPENRVYNYPNPARDGITYIRYRLEKRADVRIRIFNLAGQLVRELTGPGEAMTENEAAWDLSRVDSGVYLCHVRAESGDIVREALFKIAVVK